VAQALETLGWKDDFSDFLSNQKGLVLQDGLCSTKTVMREPTTLQVVVGVRIETPKGADERSVDLTVDPKSTVLALKEQIGQIELIPFPDKELSLDGEVLHDHQTLKECQVRSDSNLMLKVVSSTEGLANQLVELLRDLPNCMSSPNELSSLYCCRHGSSLVQALRMAGCKKELRSFFESSPQFFVSQGCVSLPGKLGLLGAIPECSAEAVDKIVNTVIAATFLNVDHVTKGGCNGTAEVVLHLNGLPPKGYDNWMAGLLHAAASTLTDIPTLSDAEVADGALQLRAQCGTSVVLRLESTAAAWVA